MDDPCKSAKCLKYPICLSKKIFQDYCPELEAYVSAHAKKINPCNNRVLSPVQIKSICRKVLNIFPNFEWISFTIIDDKSWCIIDYPEKMYKIINDNTKDDQFGITTYNFDDSDEEIKVKGKRIINVNRPM
jgi:hypothetical protein